MSLAYRAVGWNRQKRIYDLTLGGLLLLAASVFGVITALRHPDTTAETFLIRFAALAAFLLLHVILAIGPLARLDLRFLPLLYNRRHLGVTMACLALVHAMLAIVQFHAFGDRNPLVSVFTAYGRDYATAFVDFRSISQFPFEIFGLGALVILFVMAATSHDFWLRNLGPSVWKTLHMFVYVAYGLLLAHVLLGVLQSERSTVYPVLLGGGFVCIVGLHLLAALKERAVDRHRASLGADGFFPVVKAAELREGAGKVVVADGQRFALFVQGGRVFGLSNVCRHQGGPLGEGRIVNGCVTCPWHGYQYRAGDGCSPPPFTEIVSTFPVRVMADTVYLSPHALPPGTQSEGVVLPDALAGDSEFYIGWQSRCPVGIAHFVRRSVFALGALVPCVTAIVTWLQQPVDRGRFEFGVERAFEGVLYERPIPHLRAIAGGADGLDFVLVGAGKFGPPPQIRGVHGHRVRFTGSIIAREPMRMIELNRPDTFMVLDPADKPAAEPAVTHLGEGAFVGELVDTKCFLGVMRPATGKVHRGCAVRCLSGGVPPGLLVRNRSGDGVVILLAGGEGESLRYDIELAGTLIEVTGALELHGETPVLRAESIRPARFKARRAADH